MVRATVSVTGRAWKSERVEGGAGGGLFGEEGGDDVVAGVEAAAGADLGEGLVEEGFEGGAGGADAGGEVGVFEGEEGLADAIMHSGTSKSDQHRIRKTKTTS